MYNTFTAYRNDTVLISFRFNGERALVETQGEELLEIVRMTLEEDGEDTSGMRYELSYTEPDSP